ncbi:MAG: YfhO family protein [Clostridia bacterium]|nr:YfhO family protein [Clostridia bacterium]
MAFVILSGFIFSDYTLVRSGDAFHQHYKALMYFSSYAREFFANLFTQHRFVIPQWDFEVGLGSDVISTFAYYSLGDPFNYLSVFVPTEYIHYYYQFMIVFRLYCAGLAFSYLCFQTGKRNVFAVLTGAVSYCFGAYAVYAGLKHPYFVNPMVWLPLIVLGVERILKGKSVLLFVFMVALAEFSNFYFFYMLVILTVVYVLIRLVTVYKTDIKGMVAPFIKIALSSVLAVSMGAVLFLPVVFAFLGDKRSASENMYQLFYGFSYYKTLFRSFITSETPGAWLRPGMSILFLPSVAVLFTQRKKNTHLKLSLATTLIFMIFPIFGVIFNGLSYVCNRWCFAFCLVASYIVVTCWNKLLSAGKKELTAVSGMSVVVTVIALLTVKKISLQIIIPCLLLALVPLILFVAYKKKDKINIKALQVVFSLLAVVSIFVYSYYLISPDGSDYISEFSVSKRFDEVSYTTNNKMLSAAEAEQEDSDFWRYTGRDLATNASFIDGLKSTQFYWSLSNGNISAFRNEMNVSENTPYFYDGFDARTVLNTLSSVKYFVNTVKSNTLVPYGYEKTEIKGVWKNKFELPFGYTYDEYITEAEFDSLENSIDKETAMLESVVLENEVDALRRSEITTTSIKLDYEINCRSKYVTKQGNSFVVTKNGARVDFIFEPVKKSETYFSVMNLDYVGTNPYDLYSDNEAVDPDNLFSFENLGEKAAKKISGKKNTWQQNRKLEIKLAGQIQSGKSFANRFIYYTPNASFYANRKSFDINMGYTKKGMTKITITFPYTGTYSFDELNIIAQPMTEYAENVNELKAETLNNLELDYNTVKGDISLSRSKLLCMSVPYSNGWTAYVNGEKAELMRVNGMYSGLLLPEGDHEIELRYSTPGLKIGAIISLLGLAIFLALVYYYSRIRKNPDFKKSKKEGC